MKLTFLDKIALNSDNDETMPPSSSGLGHRPLTAKTGVRVPLGVFCIVSAELPGISRQRPDYRGFLLVPPAAFRLSLSLRIHQNRRLWAKEWAKGNRPSIGARSA